MLRRSASHGDEGIVQPSLKELESLSRHLHQTTYAPPMDKCDMFTQLGSRPYGPGPTPSPRPIDRLR